MTTRHCRNCEAAGRYRPDRPQNLALAAVLGPPAGPPDKSPVVVRWTAPAARRRAEYRCAVCDELFGTVSDLGMLRLLGIPADAGRKIHLWYMPDTPRTARPLLAALLGLPPEVADDLRTLLAAVPPGVPVPTAIHPGFGWDLFVGSPYRAEVIGWTLYATEAP